MAAARYITLLVGIAASLLPVATAAQDIAPVISPGQAAEGAFHRSRMGAQAQAMRNREAASAKPPVTRARQKQLCGTLPFFRERFGASHPKVRQLAGLCARAGL